MSVFYKVPTLLNAFETWTTSRYAEKHIMAAEMWRKKGKKYYCGIDR